MTHDELLEKIDEYNKFLITYSTLAEDYSTFTIVTAIRAVVELHRPFTFTNSGRTICRHCDTDDISGVYLYPCPTIQSIEKELQ